MEIATTLRDGGRAAAGSLRHFGAQHVFVVKRSMNPGFAGVQNPLFFHDNTKLVFGDAKGTVLKISEAVRKT